MLQRSQWSVSASEAPAAEQLVVRLPTSATPPSSRDRPTSASRPASRDEPALPGVVVLHGDVSTEIVADEAMTVFWMKSGDGRVAGDPCRPADRCCSATTRRPRGCRTSTRPDPLSTAPWWSRSPPSAVPGTRARSSSVRGTSPRDRHWRRVADESVPSRPRCCVVPPEVPADRERETHPLRRERTPDRDPALDGRQHEPGPPPPRASHGPRRSCSTTPRADHRRRRGRSRGLSVRGLQEPSGAPRPSRRRRTCGGSGSCSPASSSSPATAGASAEIARAAGFAHLGRFAGSYRDEFGVLPRGDVAGSAEAVA